MIYISLVAIASTVIANLLSRKRMKVALVVYGLAYFFITMWSAVVLGCYWRFLRNSGQPATLVQILTTSPMQAVAALSVFRQEALFLLGALTLWLVAVCIFAAFVGGRALAGKIRKRTPARRKFVSFVAPVQIQSKVVQLNLHLRLCRFNN